MGNSGDQNLFNRSPFLMRLGVLPSGIPMDATPRPTPPHMGKRLVDSVLKAAVGPGMIDNIPNFGTPGAAPATRYEWDRQTGKLIRGEPGGRVSGKTQERLYANPDMGMEDMLIGEVDPVFHGGGRFMRFADEFMKSGEGAHAFGWGHYLSESGGVGKDYYLKYQRMHGAPDMYKTVVRGDENWLYYQPEWLRNEVAYLYRNNVPISEWSDFLKRRKERISNSIRVNEERLKTSTQPWIEESNIYKAKEALKPMDNLINDLENGAVKMAEGSDAAGFYKAKLFPGKEEGVDYHLLDWDKPVPEEIIDKIKSRLRKETFGNQLMASGKTKTEETVELIDEGLDNIKRIPDINNGKYLYDWLSDATGSKEAASKFLERAGIDGIRYPVGSLTPGFKNKYTFKGIKLPDELQHVGHWALDNTMPESVFKESIYRQIRSLELSSKKEYQNLAKKLKSAKREDFSLHEGQKNYVIFNPKNIQIEEGPGFVRRGKAKNPYEMR